MRDGVRADARDVRYGAGQAMLYAGRAARPATMPFRLTTRRRGWELDAGLDDDRTGTFLLSGIRDVGTNLAYRLLEHHRPAT
ncbi:hypothetical protein [Phytoactinopolyspora endophytica]|uniref:hypothetical protein n=1 Tax=Phytoactinopolyspora endophytica TaxID=1642495 RepID=UPI00101BD62A|nr:hypothetical protein [Phytoactinopolyspora endophytica]